MSRPEAAFMWRPRPLGEWSASRAVRPQTARRTHVGGTAACDSVVPVAGFVDHVDSVIRRNYSPDDEDGEGAPSVISKVAGISWYPGVPRDQRNP